MKMNKIDALNQVAEFHKTFSAPILESPQIPDQKRCDLRVELLSEELKELQDAINDFNIIEVADALCDLQYVLSGAVLEFGLGDKFVDLFNEVQRSNMSKACLTQEEAEATIEHYKKKDGTEGYVKEIDGKFLVYRKEDNKVLKSINYSPAKLAEILYNVNGPLAEETMSQEQAEEQIAQMIADYSEEIKYDDAKGTIEIATAPESHITPPTQTGGPKSGGLGNVY
jgi:predicted HAD superfamily Cof-like phosphohydrolase